MKVFVTPEHTWEEFGAIRWTVTTDIVKPEALGKDEIDFDLDLLHPKWGYPTESQAREKAVSILKRNDLAFGTVTLQKEAVDWFVREDRIAEWSDIGEPEEITN
jgi:hypothetical protein